ncbi:MAG: hypothetical protein OXU36_15265 [Candidatus Poribacteria bacterium]|nr:hypothetical protein [Candidatus Poribacteria bacterium]
MSTQSRATLLSSRLDWIVLQILILFVLTVVYAVIIWQVEDTGAQTTLETFRTVVKEVVPFSQFALLCIVGIFELGGTIMFFFTHKMEEATAAGIKQGRTEGVEQGRAEVYREWLADWEKRRQEAIAKGLPFDEPPPPNPENGTRPQR